MSAPLGLTRKGRKRLMRVPRKTAAEEYDAMVREDLGRMYARVIARVWDKETR